jgi:hypothetical protein
MMERQWIVEDQTGRTVRTLRTTSDNIYVVRRQDKKRLEVRANLDYLTVKKIKYEVLGTTLTKSTESLKLPRGFVLKPAPEVVQTMSDPETKKTSGKAFHILWMLLIVVSLISLSYLFHLPPPVDATKTDLEQQLVKIVKLQEIKEKAAVAPKEDAKPTPKPKVLSRLGALAILGNLKSSAQRGGISVNAITTSAGIGLGGSQGSGGVQTSLYGKGLVSAPLGTGGNIKGAGGYGTKGKGGGQAGYGEMSLIGANGTEIMPMGQESTVDGGLDRDLIAEVVRRNL